MYRLANTDALSGLKNRRSITATIDRELDKQLAQKKLKPEMHFVICDIDYFKRINDTHGHDAGDQVIRTIAGLIQVHSPRSDFCARWGGEEFLIVFPNKTRQEVMVTIETLREEVQRTSIPHEDKKLSVTMTFGVCSMRRKETAADAIDRADKALYAGKQTGRNKVVFANE
jgi:diguanylate cyclase (GGDEF)-like protein